MLRIPRSVNASSNGHLPKGTPLHFDNSYEMHITYFIHNSVHRLWILQDFCQIPARQVYKLVPGFIHIHSSAPPTSPTLRFAPGQCTAPVRHKSAGVEV